MLVVDDEVDLHELVTFNLEQAGFTPSTAVTAAQARAQIAEGNWAALVLDWMLPDESGVDLCRALRAEPATLDLPILMLTARGDEDDRLTGFAAGADDYVVKPFSVRELVFRVQALVRRSTEARAARGARAGARHEWRGLTLDAGRHLVTLDGAPLELRPLEFKLLVTLLTAPERTFSRSDLLAEVWGVAPSINTRTVDTHVRRLRERLGAYGDLVETVHGFGYRLRAP